MKNCKFFVFVPFLFFLGLITIRVNNEMKSLVPTGNLLTQNQMEWIIGLYNADIFTDEDFVIYRPMPYISKS